MSELRKRMIEDMRLAGLSEGTQQNYVRAVRQLAVHYDLSPDWLTEEQVRQYLVDLVSKQHAARGTYLCKAGGIRFFYVQTLDVDWALFLKKKLARPNKNACHDLFPTMTLSN